MAIEFEKLNQRISRVQELDSDVTEMVSSFEEAMKSLIILKYK